MTTFKIFESLFLVSYANIAFAIFTKILLILRRRCRASFGGDEADKYSFEWARDRRAAD